MNEELLADACWIIPNDPAIPISKAVRLEKLEYGYSNWPHDVPKVEVDKEKLLEVAKEAKQSTWQRVIETTIEAYIKRRDDGMRLLQGKFLSPLPRGLVRWNLPPGDGLATKIEEAADRIAKVEPRGQTINLVFIDENIGDESDVPTPHTGRFHDIRTDS